MPARDPAPTGHHWRVVVVIPARNEETLVDRCLDALEVAIEQLNRRRPEVRVESILVLDGCSDGTAARAAARGWLRLLEIEAGNVGHARSCGIKAITGDHDRRDHTWVACTDADSAVPPTWLCDALDLADEGHDMVAGIVRVDAAELPPALRPLIDVDDLVQDGHDRIYGANLGFRLAAYDAVGGFDALPVHEDVTLVGAFRAAGLRVHASGRLAVLTSARLDGRAPAGFAGYLRDLVPPEPPATAMSPVA